MLNFTASQNKNQCREIVPLNWIFENEISFLRKKLVEEEKRLNDVMYEMIALEESIKNFFSSYYIKKLGAYISVLEYLKEKVFGRNNKKNRLEDKKHDEDLDEERLKQIYRKLVKMYHPDRYKDLSQDDKEFFEFRISEINRYFERKDLKSLERMLNQSYIEVCNDISPIERINMLKSRISDVFMMIDICQRRIEELKSDEVYNLMILPPDKREEEIKKIKDRLIIEIDIYKKISFA